MNVIFDLDGTLADLTHREHLIQGEQKDWATFFLQCVHDKPIHSTILVNNALYKAGHSIDIWTGRSDMVKVETIVWLAKYGIRYNNLKMRPGLDHTPDNILKQSWLLETPPYERPHIVFEDRQIVVDMWRSHNIQCAQVAPGAF